MRNGGFWVEKLEYFGGREGAFELCGAGFETQQKGVATAAREADVVVVEEGDEGGFAAVFAEDEVGFGESDVGSVDDLVGLSVLKE